MVEDLEKIRKLAKNYYLNRGMNNDDAEDIAAIVVVKLLTTNAEAIHVKAFTYRTIKNAICDHKKQVHNRKNVNMTSLSLSELDVVNNALYHDKPFLGPSIMVSKHDRKVIEELFETYKGDTTAYRIHCSRNKSRFLRMRKRAVLIK